MKKLLMIFMVGLISACTYHPLGMSTAEWNGLSKDERIEAWREDSKIKEQRRLRYAIERQNRLKEKRIEADIAASKATANSAAAAASAAQAASHSAAIAQQNSQNTSVNNITVNPNIIVSNVNDNAGAISQNKYISKKYIATEEKKNPYFRAPRKPKQKSNRKAQFVKRKECFEYHASIESGDRLFKKKQYRLAQKSYKRAYKKACTDEQETNAKAQIEKAKELKIKNIPSDGDDCKQYDHFMEKGQNFMDDKKYKQATKAYEKAIDFACTHDKKMEAKTSLADALSKK